MANIILTDNQSMRLQLKLISTIKIRAALTCWSKNVQDGAPHNVIRPTPNQRSNILENCWGIKLGIQAVCFRQYIFLRNHLFNIGIRQSICYLPGAHTFRVPAIFDYIGMLQSLPKLLCQFHFLVPVLFFYL